MKKKHVFGRAVIIVLVCLIIAFCGGVMGYKADLQDFFDNSTPAFSIPDIHDGFIPQGIAWDAESGCFFLTGYMGNGKTLLCRKEDSDKYTNLESINRPEVRVMENPGGLNEKFARENLPNATLIIHDTNAEIPGLIASGEADVMITEIQEAGYYVAQDERLAAPQIRRPFTHGKLGVLLPQGSEELLDYVNEFIAEEKDTGRIEELANQYIYQNLYELGEDGSEEMKPAA